MTKSKKRALTGAEMRALDRLVGKTKRGVLLARDVVRAARAKSHPLHGRFEWDAKKAAMAHWVEQARDIIQIYVTVLNGDHKPVHALVSIGTTKDDGYIPIRKALGSAATLAELREMLARDLEGVLNRYEYLRGTHAAAFRLVEKAVATLSGNGRHVVAQEGVAKAQ